VIAITVKDKRLDGFKNVINHKKKDSMLLLMENINNSRDIDKQYNNGINYGQYLSSTVSPNMNNKNELRS